MSQAYRRPFRPTTLTAPTIKSFALPDMARQLMTEDTFQAAGCNTLTDNAPATKKMLSPHKEPMPV